MPYQILAESPASDLIQMIRIPIDDALTLNHLASLRTTEKIDRSQQVDGGVPLLQLLQRLEHRSIFRFKLTSFDKTTSGSSQQSGEFAVVGPMPIARLVIHQKDPLACVEQALNRA